MPTTRFSLPEKLTLRFQSVCDVAADAQVQLLLGAYVPGIALSNDKPDRSDLVINHKRTQRTALVQKDREVTFRTTSGDIFPADLYHLIYGAVRLALMERGLFSAHAASIGREGQGHVLVTGPSGTGKTSLLARMVAEDGYKVFSGNKTVLRFDAGGGMTATAGTRTMTGVAPSFNRHAQWQGQAYAGNRTAFLLPDETYDARANVPIKAVILPRLNDGDAEWRRLSPASALHTLFPLMIDSVNADVVLDEGRAVFSGTAKPGAKAQLAASLAQVLETIPVYKAAGSMDFIKTRALTL